MLEWCPKCQRHIVNLQVERYRYYDDKRGENMLKTRISCRDCSLVLSDTDYRRWQSPMIYPAGKKL